MTSHGPISPLTSPTPAHLRGGGAGSLERALAAVAALGILLGGTQLGVGIAAGIAVGMDVVVWAVCAFTILFWIWLGAGIVAWVRRPGNGIGPLLVVGSVGVFLGGMANMQVPAFEVISSIFATSVLAVTVHLLHAFPSGRLRGAASIATVVTAYVLAIVGDLATTLLAHAAAKDASSGSSPSGAALPGAAADAEQFVQLAQTIVGLAVMTLTAVILVRRLIAADPRHRRVLLPLFLYGILAVLAIPLAPLLTRLLEADRAVSVAVQLVLIAGLPLAFLVGVLRGGFQRTTALEALSAWLAISGPARPAAQRALASTLGDDSLRVVYWSEPAGGYVDETGAPAARIPDDPDDAARAWIDVRVDGRLVGAIGYDTRLTGDAGAVRRAGEVLAIAIDRERLTAELLATNEELVQSRLRLVEAAVRERARIARDLHDGLQVQLVLLALRAQTIANSVDATPPVSTALGTLRRGIDEAAADLRRLVHDVIPATLVEQGLTAAAEDLVDRLGMPATLASDIDRAELSPATTHTAYFVIAEVLANAVKHSRAERVDVRLWIDGGRLRIDVADDGVGGARLDRGSGLRGLVDRVDVLGGAIDVASPAGEGTRVRVELPCV
ncbi:MAG: ATPase [Microbacterium sp.]|uniref:sensor histidine kinase n=1 Tax=Microbacterium sp. TaxID=51671 RepID=UPI001AC6F4E1|nr:histidine kinase [Microbacterium sp.]MBN9177589.1 ATPase [Microbacterium sp.]